MEEVLVTEDEPKVEDLSRVTIKCPRFGGTRHPYACGHFDRYRGCRKNCEPLKKFIEVTKDYEKTVGEIFLGRESFLTAKGSCKGLPHKAEFACWCGFEARSERGLKSHKTRSEHK